MPASILVVKGDDPRLEIVTTALRGMGHHIVTVPSWQEEVLDQPQKQTFNIVLIGIDPGQATDLEILETTREHNPEAVVIILAEYPFPEVAQNILEEWPNAYILRFDSLSKIKNVVNNALREQELLVRNRRLVESLQRANHRMKAANQALQQASRAKSDFLAKMSHELRTPLNVIIGFTQLMLDRVPGDINEEQKQCLSDILTSGQHLLGLINEVLDLSRVEAGRVRLELKRIDLRRLLDEVRSTTVPLLLPKKQHLELDLADGLPPLQADETRLRQVLFNLMSNASRFTPPGGTITVRAERRGRWCLTSVNDNGVGIKSEDMDQLFEPFFQVEGADGSEGRGSGLGLALVKEIVEWHGGRVWVESEYGRGSSFIFSLPLAAPDGLSTSEVAGEKGAHRRG